MSGAAAFDPYKEAETIVMQSSDSLLPDPKLIEKVQADVALIREQHDEVKYIRNHGVTQLGQVLVIDYYSALLDKINKSEFGPATLKSKSWRYKGWLHVADAVVEFSKPYNPHALVKELAKLGITATPIVHRSPYDSGDIEYIKGADVYSFPRYCYVHYCSSGPSSWKFSVTDGKATLSEETSPVGTGFGGEGISLQEVANATNNF